MTELEDLLRAAYWFARHHPTQGEKLDIELLVKAQAKDISALFRKAGWVEKEEDQSLPEIPDYLTEDEKQVRLATMHIMQYQGWRKVKEEE